MRQVAAEEREKREMIEVLWCGSDNAPRPAAATASRGWIHNLNAGGRHV